MMDAGLEDRIKRKTNAAPAPSSPKPEGRERLFVQSAKSPVQGQNLDSDLNLDKDRNAGEEGALHELPDAEEGSRWALIGCTLHDLYMYPTLASVTVATSLSLPGPLAEMTWSALASLDRYLSQAITGVSPHLPGILRTLLLLAMIGAVLVMGPGVAVGAIGGALLIGISLHELLPADKKQPKWKFDTYVTQTMQHRPRLLRWLIFLPEPVQVCHDPLIHP